MRCRVPAVLFAVAVLPLIQAGCSDRHRQPASGPVRDPDAAASHVEAAGRWAMQGQFGAAVADGRKALELDPEAKTAYRVLGYAYYRLKRLPEARQALERAILANPDDPFANCFLGLTYAEHPRTPAEQQRARELLQQASGRYQGAEAWYGLGLLALRQGDVGEAIRHLREAVRVDPGWETGRYRLAEAYRRAGRKQEADREARAFHVLKETRSEFERLSAVVAQAPPDDAARLQRARLAVKTQRYRDALEHFRVLAGRAPGREVFDGLRAAAEAVGERDLAARASAALQEAPRP